MVACLASVDGRSRVGYIAMQDPGLQRDPATRGVRLLEEPYLYI